MLMCPTRQWLIAAVLLVLFLGVSSLSVCVRNIKPNYGKALLSFSIIVLDAIILKLVPQIEIIGGTHNLNGIFSRFIGFGMYWMYKHMRNREIIILDKPKTASARLTHSMTPSLTPSPPPLSETILLNNTITLPAQIATITISTQTV